MPIPLRYTAEMLALRIEQMFWHLAQIERTRITKRPIAPNITSMKLKSAVPVGALNPWGRRFQNENLPMPLIPASSIWHLVTDLKATGCLVLDCLGMSADDVLRIWHGWPKSVTERGISPVFIVDTQMHDAMAREGAVVEFLYESPYRSQPGWSTFERERLEFIRRKYGVARLSSGRAFLPRPTI